MAKKIDIPKDNNIVKVPLEEAMPDNYLPYAVEVAKDRALPDVRDGLKPVHRRILYGAYVLKAFPDKPYYKSARIVGDILGKYHPHGDASVYDSMVILAQDFATRMPLIDGHGNWGSQDGDNAAAMRYTEARLTKLALEMIKDLDKDVVDMMDNYSATELEPKVMPGRYPNLLVNGAFGIAVGLATNIPPHNLGEVIDATLAFIDNNNIEVKELMEYIKGPDLPTGGIIIGKNALISAYETGEGKVTLRSKTAIEKLETGRLGIVITEFPFRRSKAKLLQTISEMTDDKRHAKVLEPIIDIRDESDRNGIRAVIEFKKAVDEEIAEKILKYLYKKTELQCNVSFNMVALANGKPETLGLKAILKYYVEHQKEVVTRRTTKELQIAEKRFHIVEGFIKAIDIIDEIIATIRASKSKKDSENNLMIKYGFTELQAEAIVELMLYRLTGLEIKTFEKEYKELEKEIKKLKKILDNEMELLKVIKSELLEIKDKYADSRRTTLVEDDEIAKINLEELVVVEDTMVTMSKEGFIKRVPLKSYNRSNSNVEDIEYREGDFNKFLFGSNTIETVIFFTDKGNMYQTKGINIPEHKWKDKGVKVDEIIRGLDLSVEKIVSVYSMPTLSANKDLIFFTSKGVIKKTSLEKFVTNYSKIAALRLKEEEKLMDVRLVEADREEGAITVQTKLGLCFTLEEPRLESTDRNIMGLQLFNVSTKDEIIKVDYTLDYEYKAFNIELNKDGLIKVKNDNRISKKSFKSATDTRERLLIFTEKGLVFQIASFMIANLAPEGISIDNLVDDYDKKDNILNVISVKDNSNNIDVYFFTKKGLVKKTQMSEFQGPYTSTMAYKLKGENDSLIGVSFRQSEEAKDILIVTKRAMSIRFDETSVNYMGKVASGVTGISLKEDDEVIYGALIPKQGTSEQVRPSDITLLTYNKDSHSIKIKDVKQQNRAGRGNSMMIIVMDDYVQEVQLT